jgi:two-component system, OmpR family, heavy metal sensor histidine kinase CusS
MLRPPRSLRLRLTLGFAVIATLVLVAAATLLDRQIRAATWAAIDAALLEEAELLATLPGGVDLAAAVAQVARERDYGPGKFVLVLDANGAVRAEAGAVPRLLRAALPSRAAVTRELRVHGHLRGLRLVRHDAADGTLVLGVDAGRPLAALRTMRRRIALGAATVLVLLVLLVWIVTTRATRELHRLAQEIEAVEASTLARRLARRDTLEVDGLVLVLNRLLGRLEAAVGHLRRFTADAAHELRTPVAALRATLEVALGRERPEGWRDGLLDGLEQAERLGRLSEDLLALSAVEAGALDAAREPVRLDRLVAEVLREMDAIAAEQHRPFRWDAGGEAWVSGVPSFLRRVIVNLVDNAFRHTPPTSAVRVEVASEDGWVRVAVADEGPGIADEDRPRVFERFARGRGAVSPGTGLGLALSREIAERHHGRLDVDSQARRGTRAVLALPLVAPAGAVRVAG